MRDLGFITRVGPISSRPSSSAKEPTTTTPFRIEVGTPEGPAVLSLSPSAAAELSAELVRWLQVRGSP